MSKNPIEALLDKVDFTPVEHKPSDSGLPYVTHEGILHLGETAIKVCVLSNGQRIIPMEEIDRIFGGFEL